MKKMRAIKIDPVANEITEIVIEGKDVGETNQEIYKHIGNDCHCFACVDISVDGKTNTIFVDDEGLLKEIEGGIAFADKKMYHEPLVGRVVILGFIPSEGETTDTTLTAEWCKKNIAMLSPIELYMMAIK